MYAIMSYAGDILKEVKEKTPKYGFNVCLFDDYEDVGEKLVILAHVDTAQEADEVANEYEDQTIYIYEGTEEEKEKAGEGIYDIQPMLTDIVEKAFGLEEYDDEYYGENEEREFSLDELLNATAKILAGKAGKKLGLESKANERGYNNIGSSYYSDFSGTDIDHIMKCDTCGETFDLYEKDEVDLEEHMEEHGGATHQQYFGESKANESSYLKNFTYSYNVIHQGGPSPQYINQITCKICDEPINNNHGWDDPEPLCKSHLLQHDMVFEKKANEVSVSNMSDKELNDAIYQFDKYSGGGDEYYEQELRDEAWRRKSKKIQAFNKAQQEAGTNEPYVVDMMSKSSTESKMDWDGVPEYDKVRAINDTSYPEDEDYDMKDKYPNMEWEDLSLWVKDRLGIWFMKNGYLHNQGGGDLDGQIVRYDPDDPPFRFSTEGGRGSGKVGHQPWMLDAEGTQCKGCGMLTNTNEGGNCDICGV